MHGVREYGKDFTFSELTYADLKGLAPLLIQVGAAETLLGDAIRLAKAAGAADVRVDLQIWPEMVHVWHMFHPELKGWEAGNPGGRRLHTRGDGAVASSNSGDANGPSEGARLADQVSLFPSVTVIIPGSKPPAGAKSTSPAALLGQEADRCRPPAPPYGAGLCGSD